MPIVPILGILICGYMMYGLPGDTWIRLIVWMAIGLVDLLPLRQDALAAWRRRTSGRDAADRQVVSLEAAPISGRRFLFAPRDVQVVVSRYPACPPRRDPALASALNGVSRVAVTTHINADGDGCGSEAALARLLAAARAEGGHREPHAVAGAVRVPARRRRATTRARAAPKRSRSVDVLIVARHQRREAARQPRRHRASLPGAEARDRPSHRRPTSRPATSCSPTPPPARPVSSCTTSRSSLGLEITPPSREALYAAMLTDTGGFRFSNTSPRAHAIAAELLATGVDPEDMYRRIYASVPPGRLHLLRDALDTLGVDERVRARLDVGDGRGAGAVRRRRRRISTASSSMRGRSPGTRVALFFRDLGHGKVKVSFRSTGDVDVNAFARQFGGGGHAKASGALVGGNASSECGDRVVTAAARFPGSRCRPTATVRPPR